MLSHRFIYEYYYGNIDPILTIDHLCKNPACCNPLHLQQVTQKVNIRRGLSGKINNRQAEKTHCIYGHGYTPENTGFQTNGRYCKMCDKLRKRENYYIKVALQEY